MQQKYFRLASIAALTLGSGTALALPFNSFDPRSMAMGGTGVAVDEPGTAPFFNPALLSADDNKRSYSFELPVIGIRLYDPAKMRDTLPTLSDDANALTASTTPLSNNSTTLQNDTATLTTNITNLANVGTPTAGTLATVSANLTTVKTNMTTVSGDMTTVSNNSTTVQTNLNKVNSSLLALNNKPLQGEFGAAMVIGVPGKNYGMAFYTNAWGAAGGTLIYKDAGTVNNISGALGTTSTALTSSSNLISATSTAQTDLNAAIAALNTANTNCNVTPVASCTTDLANAQAKLLAAQASLSSASTTLSGNATTITNAASTVTANKTALSQIHLRGVLVTETGLSISHGFVTRDQEWALGVTPKYMQLQLFDALLDANTGNANNATGSDNVAKYSTLNFDMGVAKSYLNGWRTGVVVKNVLPQKFDFKRAPTAGATPVATGDTLNLNPQLRAGVSHENAWSTIAFDLDLTQNDPAGLENKSQYAALGGELSALGWAQLRAGYRADMLNSARNVTSFGLGISPRIPYFKIHFDLAYAYNADEQGASLRFGMNF
jgi:hypothetical protein